jgi:hypothetical protein
LDGSGAVVRPIGGQAVPGVGGYMFDLTLGESVSIEGTALSAPGIDLLGASTVRIVRPRGEFVDYAGPGVGWFSELGRAAEDKGLEVQDFVAELDIVSTEGGTAVLLGVPPTLLAGDRVFVGQAGHDAGAPGWTFAKTMADAEGSLAVAHYRAVDIVSDNRIAPGSEGSSEHIFDLSSGATSIEVTATLIKRRYPAALADQYGWPSSDLELRSAGAAWSR